LHLAASNGSWGVVWTLLGAGADASVRGKDGHTPLALANAIALNFGRDLSLQNGKVFELGDIRTAPPLSPPLRG
jgi:hypothetical protein